MTNLSNANKVRKDKALNKLWNFSDYGVKSFKQLIDMGIFIKSEIYKESKIKWNRVKFNRMNFREQEAYELKMKETKNTYLLYYNETTSTECSRFVFDYFNETQYKECCSECKKDMNDLEHNYGTEDTLVCIHCYNDAVECQSLLGINV